jgi:hypothetical protein
MTTESSDRQSCARCGAHYEVLVTEKFPGAQNQHVICDCGWPLKDWVGVKAYTFRRVPSPRPAWQESEKDAQRQ